ncbi:MAG TPA: DegT/DnrJ/EryC1/StrS family aminotransferase [Pyrinomonadaceae bacterium]|nr:DegT/DnrJ/EryC1/StrS family aminotransferase [Pyrinomonadaceae bacterium]
MATTKTAMNIPLINLKAQFAPLRAEMLQSLERILDSQQFVLGPEVKALEEEVATYSSVKHAIGCSSGSDALLLALMALGVKAGDEVITASFTFFATGGAIARLGARPVFVDIDPRTFTIDPKRVEAAITAKTKAIIPVHMYGLCADMDPLLEISERRGVPIIEDAAQAIGAEDRGRKAASMGSIGCYSFYPTKNLGAAGDAGMVTTNDDGLAERLRTLRVHGGLTEYLHEEVGINGRLDAFQAAVLRVKLPHLDDWARTRQEKAKRYNELFAAANLPFDVTPPYVPETSSHVYHVYNVKVSTDRDALMEHLGKCGVGTKVYYPVPLHLQECFRYLGYGEGDLPESERAARESFALPVYPEITDEEQQYVVDCFKSFQS